MPMPRCSDCGRVLNQDGSCSRANECEHWFSDQDPFSCAKCEHLVDASK